MPSRLSSVQMATFATVDEYIASFPPDVRRTLTDVRAAIRAAVPGTEERISYGIPTFTLDGRYVVYFSGWKRHVSVYPIPDADADLARRIAPYQFRQGHPEVSARRAYALRADRGGCRAASRAAAREPVTAV